MKNRISEKNNFDIAYYQNYVKELYYEVNQRRSFEEVYGYLVRTSGYLCKTLRSNTQDRSKYILSISWLLTLSTNLEIDLQDSFCKKYPGICPNCLEPQCICFTTSKMPSKHISVRKIQEEMYFRYETIKNTVKIYNLDKAVKNITEIFTVNQMVWHFNGAWRHIAKIFEEISEIHEAVGELKKGKKPLTSVAEEIVDVLAWILSAWGIIFPNQSLDDAFVDYYFNGCPNCSSFPCKCGNANGKPSGLVDYNKLTTVKEKLVELSKILPDYKDDMDELNRSYEYVLQTQNEPTAKVVVSQTREVIEKIRNKTTDSDKPLVQIPKADIKHYDVFLSYSTVDKDEARKIETFLTKKKFKVFLSEKAIKPSEEWKDELKSALENSGLLCVLATPNSLKSEWVTREQGAAWMLGIRILPILFQCSTKDLPEILKDYQTINFHEMAKIVDVLKEISK